MSRGRLEHHLPSMTNRPTFPASATFRKVRQLDFTQVGIDHLVIDPENGFCWALNAVGVRVWNLLDSRSTLASICDRLQSEFAVDEETCRLQTSALVAQMVEAGLVRPVE